MEVMEELKETVVESSTAPQKTNNQTIIGKILGWFFGIISCLFIFTIFDKEAGAISFGLTIIGILLLPPVNMRLRCKYQDFVKAHHGEKYSLNLINLGYASMKIIFAFVLLLVLSSFGTKDTSSQKAIVSPEKTSVENKSETQNETKAKPKVSIEFMNALIKAETYSETMNLSKRGIYDQLVSEYGEKFPADAAQYAIDNIKTDFKMNALAKAKSYQREMNMSKSAIYDQLTSEYGEKFTAQEARYAIDHLND